MTFTHRFNARLSCTVQVPDDPPEHGAPHTLAMEWQGEPTPAIVPEYVRWVLVINQHCADRWNVRIGYAVQTGRGEWQFWSFAPGEMPTLQQTFHQEVTP